MWSVSAVVIHLIGEGFLLGLLLHVFAFSFGRLFGLIKEWAT